MLDVLVEAQILALLSELKTRTRAGFLLITHNLGIVAEACERVAVMYAGRIVEIGPTRDVLTAPRHPYTRGLLASVPKVAPGASRATLAVGVTGELSHDEDLSRGCPFRFRCPQRRDLCDTVLPALEGHGSARVDVACHFPQESGSLQESVR